MRSKELRNTPLPELCARGACDDDGRAFTSSIAHEVNQPLFGIMTNTDTCLLMLSTDPPDVDYARETTQRTMRDAKPEP